MKAKDLKSDYTFAERRPYLEDHIFYVPQHYPAYDVYTLPPFATLFGNGHATAIEYCSGNGDWIAEQARLHPEKNWIAVEKRFDRVRKIWAKLKNHRLNNLLIVCGEAFTFTHHYLPAQVIDETFIHFPDPWPKGKHAKHRLLQVSFLDELARILKGGKQVSFVTDDRTYLAKTIALFCHHPLFTPLLASPHYTTQVENYGNSWFENLWREKGREIHYTHFVKYADPR